MSTTFGRQQVQKGRDLLGQGCVGLLQAFHLLFEICDGLVLAVPVRALSFSNLLTTPLL